jgi:NDP-sugar pyrophosphorylase family protein
MKAIIIAGGKGERLRPLTNNLPKPMIEVAGKPILEHIITLFNKNGIRDFILALCYLPKKITSYFGNGKKFGVKITYTFEDINKPMGTTGAILQAKKYIESTFIVTYADILRELDIKNMIRHHKKKKAFTTINVYKRFGSDPKSMVIFNKDGRVEKFIERPKPQDLKDDFVWANGSFYIFEPEVFDFIPKDKPSDFGKDIFPKILKAGKPIFAYPSSGYFVDIGNLEKLEKAKKTFTRSNVLTV